MTLLETTLRDLQRYGKSPKDIRYIQTSKFNFSWENFKNVADFELGVEYNAPLVTMDLVIVGDDWYMERVCEPAWFVDYWTLRQIPKKLSTTKEISKNDLVSKKLWFVK